MEDVNNAYEWLIENEYFTEEELSLVTNGWGYSMETLDIACQVKYAMDVEQLIEEGDK